MTATVKRRKKGVAGKVDVNAVDHCVQYNRYMGGCDVAADMKRALCMSRSRESSVLLSSKTYSFV
jgi:hypothetical protein